MKIEDFNALSDEEKAAVLAGAEANEKKLSDVTAERDSFKAENDKLNAENTAKSAELQKTKELNFTLARQVDVNKSIDPEQQLYDFIKGVKER